MRAAPFALPPSTDGMAMVCMIDEPIGGVRGDESRFLGVFREVCQLADWMIDN